MKNIKYFIVVLVFLIIPINIYALELSNDMDEYQQGVVEVAMQYYYKGLNILYQQNSMFIGNTLKEFPNIKNNASIPFSPEEANINSRQYVSNSTLIYQIYNEAFCYEIMPFYLTSIEYFLNGYHNNEYDIKGYKEKFLEESPDSIYYYETKASDTLENIEYQKNEIAKLLQVGDIIIIKKSNNIGYTMIYIGNNNYIDASGGGNYNFNNKARSEQSLKPAIQLGNMNELFNQEQYYSLFYSNDNFYNWNTNINQDNQVHTSEILIIRPLNDIRNNDYNNICYQNTKERLKYKGLSFEKTISLSKYNIVNLCDEIEYTITITNHSNNDYNNIPIIDSIPNYTTYNGEKNKVLSWNINVKSKEIKEIKYKVKVIGNENIYGEYIESKDGSVGGIKLNSFKHTVGSNLTKKEENVLKNMALKNDYASSIEMISDIYNNIFNYNGFSNIKEDDFISSVLEIKKTSYNDNTLTLNISDTELGQMAVDNLYGGYFVFNKTVDEWYNRVKNVREKDLQIGDIITFISYNDDINKKENWYYNIYLYIGDSKLITISNNQKEIISSKELLDSLIGQVAFTIHRPSMIGKSEIKECNNTLIEVDKTKKETTSIASVITNFLPSKSSSGLIIIFIGLMMIIFKIKK